MCGIVGYIGTKNAAPIILDGLAKLEYRGYDSAGMAIFDGEKINITKAVGRLKVLEEMTHGGETMNGHCGIGHTRWATHGVPYLLYLLLSWLFFVIGEICPSLRF